MGKVERIIHMKKELLKKLLTDRRFRQVALLSAYVFSVGVASEPWH